MVQQGSKIGVDWESNVATLEKKQEMLLKYFDDVESKAVEYPEYYLRAFHAYDDGNLWWVKV